MFRGKIKDGHYRFFTKHFMDPNNVYKKQFKFNLYNYIIRCGLFGQGLEDFKENMMFLDFLLTVFV